MALQDLWTALETSSVGDFVASSAWAFPAIEAVHVLAVVTVVATVAIMDMRLLGWVMGRRWVVVVASNQSGRWSARS